MKHKMMKLLLAIYLTLTIAMALSSPGYALCSSSSSASLCSACSGLTTLDPAQGCSSNGSGVNSLITTTISILSWIVGILAIIMIIISGIRFILSSGNANNVESAKKTLIYAIVGLVIAAIAQLLVSGVFSSVAATGSIYDQPALVKLKDW